MYKIPMVYLFLAFSCLEYVNTKSNIECIEHMVTYPPQPSTGCCSDIKPAPKRLDSLKPAIHQYPWTALIEYSKRDKIGVYCGGALISGRYVLTSAHCITSPVNVIGIPKNIRLGDYNTTKVGPDCAVGPEFEEDDCTEGATTIKIESFVAHPGYNSNKRSRGNDIGLIRMKELAPYTDFIRPICLPTEDVTLKTRPLRFVFAGWGTSYGPSDVKLHLELPFVDKEKCQKQYSSYTPNIQFEEGQLCAGGEKGKDSCLGDGGLPLIYENAGKYEIVGVVSFGASVCGTENIPSIYTNVFKYISWINSNITP